MVTETERLLTAHFGEPVDRSLYHSHVVLWPREHRHGDPYAVLTVTGEREELTTDMLGMTQRWTVRGVAFSRAPAATPETAVREAIAWMERMTFGGKMPPCP